MKYFIVEGTLTSSNPICDNIMKEHMSYSGKAMEKGLMLITGLKEDMSGVIFVMKGENLSKINEYLSNEPLKIHGFQDYKVTEFSPHYFNPSPKEWFHNKK